ncbi:hypothetical protein AAC387_Pa07g3566 [Persea americana]
MALSKTFLAFLLFTILALNLMDDGLGFQSHSLPTPADERNLLQQIDCGASCSARCRLSSRPRLCKRACGTCCARCNCVPSGTAGNLDECPCYANMTTHGNKRKCP